MEADHRAEVRPVAAELRKQTLLDSLFKRPNKNGDRGTARALGLYIARAMAEAAGGHTEARYAEDRRGLTLIAEFPIAEPASKARMP